MIHLGCYLESLCTWAPGGCFTNSDGLADSGRTILLSTNNMGRWSVAQSDGPMLLLLVKQPPVLVLMYLGLYTCPGYENYEKYLVTK